MFVVNKRLLRLVAILVGNVEDTTGLLAYVTWHVARHLAPMTSYSLTRTQFMDGSDADTTALGYMTSRCYVDADTALPLAFADVFNRRWLPMSSVRNATAILGRIRSVANATIGSLSWIDDETKHGALKKLATLRAIVAGLDQASGNEEALRKLYPYVPELSGSYLDMSLALHAAELNFSKGFLRVNGPTTQESGVSLTVVNAFYIPVYHVMVIPAAILYPPFYVAGYPSSYNFASLGHVVGHEMTHAFHPDEAMFDRDGLRRNWWTPVSRKMFARQLACFRRLYNETPWTGAIRYGDNALSENLADSGGLLKAYRAYQESGAQQSSAAQETPFSDEQLFFASSCFKWCSNDDQSPAWYSPPRARCNVPLMNMPEFAQAFECAMGTAMNPTTRCSAM